MWKARDTVGRQREETERGDRKR
jgi:hypothetical protein